MNSIILYAGLFSAHNSKKIFNYSTKSVVKITIGNSTVYHLFVSYYLVRWWCGMSLVQEHYR